MKTIITIRGLECRYIGEYKNRSAYIPNTPKGSNSGYPFVYVKNNDKFELISSAVEPELFDFISKH